MRIEKLMVNCLAGTLITGCVATLEQFSEMGPYDRALMVCDNSLEARAQKRKINSMADKIYTLSSDIALRRGVLDRGYRIHRECWRQYATRTVCQELTGGRIECREERDPNDWVGEEVCKETPVTIDADYEENKLEGELERLASAKIKLANLKSGYRDNRERCYLRAEQLSPEEAHEHYKNQDEPSNDDVFYKI